MTPPPAAAVATSEMSFVPAYVCYACEAIMLGRM